MTDLFYRAFEERYRGSRELIKTRLEVYLPFIKPLLRVYPSSQTLDLGCGRGEWLELLSEQGFDPFGVDLDDGMLQICREKGLKVKTADALTWLRSLPPESQTIVSGFHIAEHLPFDVLQQLVVEAKRVLRPGGLLILETPNPENISVGTSSFYLDPSHQRPIPPDLLLFLAEHYGFAISKIIRLQEDAILHNLAELSLMNVINGASPDFAMVAQKQGNDALMIALKSVFSHHYGLTLNHLADSYQASLDRRFKQISMMAQEALTQAERIEAIALQAIARTHDAELRAMKAEALHQHYMAQLNNVQSSKSWRMMAPLRWVKTQVIRLLREGVKDRVDALIKKVLRKINNELAHRTRLRRRLTKLSRKFGLYEWFKVLNIKVQAPGPLLSSYANSPAGKLKNLSELTPRARQIYEELKQAIKNKQNGEA